MKRIILPFIILLSAVMLVTSCLSDTDNDVVYYSDTAMTSFTLGTLNRYYTGKNSAGTADSTYTTTVTGSDYKMYIDQKQGLVYNADSLPQGTDIAHVLCTVNSKNGGYIIIKNVDSDTLNYYSSSDSIDFTTTREFRVVANDASAYRKYMVTLNVHKEYPDSFRWYKESNQEAFEGMKGMKAVTIENRLYVFGLKDNATVAYTANADDINAGWTKLNTNKNLDADAYKNVVAHNNSLFTITAGKLIVSTDGQNWRYASDINGAVGTDDVKQLLGAGNTYMYALDADHNILHSASGGVWEQDNLADDKAQLPMDNYVVAGLKHKNDSSVEEVVLAGLPQIGNAESDTLAVLWNKIEETKAESRTHSWNLNSEKNSYNLPAMAGLTILNYGGKLIALGGQNISAAASGSTAAFSHIYTSEDNGLTWHNDKVNVLPSNFSNSGSNVFAMTVDKENRLWIICGGNGNVWRGRLNKLGWKQQQTSFIK